MIENSSQNSEGVVWGGEFKKQFDGFIEDITDSFLVSSEDMQAKFVKFYDNLTIGFKVNSIKSSAERLLLENENLIEKVQKVKLHNKIIKNMNSFDATHSEDDDNDVSLSI